MAWAGAQVLGHLNSSLYHESYLHSIGPECFEDCSSERTAAIDDFKDTLDLPSTSVLKFSDKEDKEEEDSNSSE